MGTSWRGLTLTAVPYLWASSAWLSRCVQNTHTSYFHGNFPSFSHVGNHSQITQICRLDAICRPQICVLSPSHGLLLDPLLFSLTMSSNYYGTQRYNSTQISYSSGSYNCPLDMFIDMTPWDIKINTPTLSLQPHSQTYFKSLPFLYCSCIYLFRSSEFSVINYSSPLCLRPIPFPIMLHASRQLMLPSERHRLEVL